MSALLYAGASEPSPRHRAVPDSRFKVLGELTEFAVHGPTLVLRCGGPALAVTLLDADVLRVRLAPSGTFTEAHGGAAQDPWDEPFSYAVEDSSRFGFPDLDVHDLGDRLQVTTEVLTVEITKRPCRLTVRTPDGRTILEDDAGAGWTPEGSVRAWKTLAPDEHFFGLGDKTFPLDRRGRRYTFWNADTYAYEPGQDPIYKSIPFLLGLKDGGRTGYGLFLDNSFRATFDLGEADAEQFWIGAEDGELRYYLFAGGEGPEALAHPLRRYADLTGHKPMPPRWSLGYHQSRWNYHDSGYALWIAHEFRRRGIPLECVHLDIAHMDGYRVFTWDPDRFPDPAQTMRHLGELGVKAVCIVDPGVKVDEGYDAYCEGCEGDLFHTNPDGSCFTDTVWPGDVHWPDFSKPEARAWWGERHRAYTGPGVAGIWNDMNEPAVLGGKTFPDSVRFDFEGRGGTHAEGHNLYGLLMAKATYEGLRALKDERPFLLTRACFSGSQRYAAAWTGDNVSTWEHLRLSVQICQSLSASGMAFCGPDIGGFAGAPSGELFARWMQAGVFYPFMRTHYSHEEIDQQEPWSFGERVEAIAKRYIGLRYELMPYVYTAFATCCRTARPPMRPLVLEHPQDPRSVTADDQFYFGDALLAAPVVEEGARGRAVWLPDVPGGWFDWWTGEALKGGQVPFWDAPLDALPLFAKAGSVVPLYPVMDHTDAFVPEALVLRAFPGEATSEVYHDDGRTYAFETGDFSRLTIEQSLKDDGLDFRVSREGDGGLPHRTLEWQVPEGTATAATADGIPLPPFDTADAFEAASEGVFAAPGRAVRVRTRTDVRHLTLAQA